MYTQRLLVLLFGTFRSIASNSEMAGTGMTSEALGVSVAPSFFHSCVSDGKTAKMEDVMRYKVFVPVRSELYLYIWLYTKDNAHVYYIFRCFPTKFPRSNQTNLNLSKHYILLLLPFNCNVLLLVSNATNYHVFLYC